VSASKSSKMFRATSRRSVTPTSSHKREWVVVCKKKCPLWPRVRLFIPKTVTNLSCVYKAMPYTRRSQLCIKPSRPRPPEGHAHIPSESYGRRIIIHIKTVTFWFRGFFPLFCPSATIPACAPAVQYLLTPPLTESLPILRIRGRQKNQPQQFFPAQARRI
jgi:hypothetical protein